MSENETQESPFIPVRGLLGVLYWGLIKKKRLTRIVTCDGEEAIVRRRD